MMISCRGIKKSYGKLDVLKSIDLDIEKAEVVALVGPSGAGKSTLLHIAGTLDTPDTGTIELAGQNPFTLNARKLAAFRNAHIGFIFQFHHLLPEFSAIENVCIPAFICGTDKAEAESRAIELLQMLGLGLRIQHKPGELSGGEQQRVAVARALMNKPSVILADEPSGNLDTKNAQELHNLFFELRDKYEQTFLIVTHNRELAEMADRQIVMRDGLIVDEK